MPTEAVVNGNNQEWVMHADLPLTAAIRQSQQTLYVHTSHPTDRQGRPRGARARTDPPPLITPRFPSPAACSCEAEPHAAALAIHTSDGSRLLSTRFLRPPQ